MRASPMHAPRGEWRLQRRLGCKPQHPDDVDGDVGVCTPTYAEPPLGFRCRFAAARAPALAIAHRVLTATIVLRMAMRPMSVAALPRRARLALALFRTRCMRIQAQRRGRFETAHLADGDFLIQQLANVAQQA